MAKREYNTTQLELYAAAKAGWASFARNQVAFGIFRPIYTAVFGQQRIAEITAAENLPDEQARNSTTEIARINLVNRGKVCTDLWQTLKRYITAAFNEQLQKPKLEEAGSKLYAKAISENWEVLNGLNVAASKFIANNNAALANNQNMPASFPANYNNAKAAFETDYGVFISAESNTVAQTEAKITANNTMYARLISMFLDGQDIFKNNAPLRKEFVFDEVIKLISSPGTAGLKGLIINADAPAKTPLANVTVTILELAKTVQSRADGTYQFSAIKAGDFTVKFEKAGFVTLQFDNFTIPTGTTVTKDVAMKPVVV